VTEPHTQPWIWARHGLRIKSGAGPFSRGYNGRLAGDTSYFSYLITKGVSPDEATKGCRDPGSMLSKNPVFGCRELSRYPMDLGAMGLQTQLWLIGAAGAPARGHFVPLAGDTNYFSISSQRRIPGRTREAGETRGPCRHAQPTFRCHGPACHGPQATGHKPLFRNVDAASITGR